MSLRPNDKRTLYVGGLEDNAKEADVHAAFIPFGELVEVNIPLDNQTGKHRGFCFVEFENAGDAAEAVFNMNNAELFGRVLKVNPAKPMAVTERSGKAVWHADADAYFEAVEEFTEEGAKHQDDGLEPAKAATADEIEPEPMTF